MSNTGVHIRTCASSASTSARWTRSSAAPFRSSPTREPRSTSWPEPRRATPPAATTGRWSIRSRRDWNAEVDRLYAPRGGAPFAQAALVGAVNAFAGPRDVVVGAAGSVPGDLHKLWRSREPNTYHLEYGYSCMGYEIAGGLGVKMADRSREVIVMVGDGSYLMMAQEIVTSVQEGYKLIIVLLDSQGYASIGGAVAIGRLGRVRHAVRLPLADRSGRQRGIARRDRLSAGRSRVVCGGAAVGARGGSDRGDLRGGRSAAGRAGLRLVVERAGRRSIRATGRAGRAASLGEECTGFVTAR